MTQTTSSIEEQRARLEAIGQAHVLAFVDELGADEQEALASQLASLELEKVPAWVDRFVANPPAPESGEEVEVVPAPVVRRGEGDWDEGEMRAAGEELIREGRVAAFTVAGGQGTRLGFDGPKGMYPSTPVTGKPLFACLAEWLHAANRRWGVDVPWYIMTSPINHGPTVEFFETNGHFGLPRDSIRFFSQGVLPSLDKETGRMLLAEKGAVATNPDGHGGSLKALHTSGALAEMLERGIEHISYVQIDNPLARVLDPVFLGLHANSEYSTGEMSTKVVRKEEPGEKVGVLGVREGKTMVVEYSDLSDEMAERRDEKGRLSFSAGNIAIHAIGVDFVERLNAGDEFALPLHRAVKKVPYVDIETGERVEPDEPNAVKLESFVFDALPMCERSLVFEVDRIDEFAPIKNAEGKDSPASSRNIQIERAARWLEARGVEVARDESGEVEGEIEISPVTATRAEELDKSELPRRVGRDDSVVL